MWEHVARQQGDIFYAHWAEAAAASNSVSNMSLITSMQIDADAEVLWSQALNTLAGLYYANEGWRTPSSFQVPPAWRNDAITNMMEKMLRTSYPGYGKVSKQKQVQPQVRLPTGPPLSAIVLLYPHKLLSKGRDGPGKSRLAPSAGMQQNARTSVQQQQPCSSSSHSRPNATARSSMLRHGAAPLRAAQRPNQAHLQMPLDNVEGDEHVPSVYSQVVLGDTFQVEMPTMICQKKKQKIAANLQGIKFMA